VFNIRADIQLLRRIYAHLPAGTQPHCALPTTLREVVVAGKAVCRVSLPIQTGYSPQLRYLRPGWARSCATPRFARVWRSRSPLDIPGAIHGRLSSPFAPWKVGDMMPWSREESYSVASTVCAGLGGGKQRLVDGRCREAFELCDTNYRACSPFSSPFHANTRPYRRVPSLKPSRCAHLLP
jgi:hypothetical protein